MPKQHTIAVLTGDLVNSTALGAEGTEAAMTALHQTAKRIEGCGITQAPLHFTRHRGDGWQVVVDAPRYALRVAVTLRAAVRSLGDEYDSYIGLAEGPVQGGIGPDLNAENAPVFITSGRTLDIARRSPHWMSYAKGGAYEATAILLDRMCRDWTPVQAATLHAAMDHPANTPSLTDLAEKLGKSRQSATKSLSSAGYWEITAALNVLESSFDD